MVLSYLKEQTLKIDEQKVQYNFSVFFSLIKTNVQMFGELNFFFFFLLTFWIYFQYDSWHEMHFLYHYETVSWIVNVFLLMMQAVKEDILVIVGMMIMMMIPIVSIHLSFTLTQQYINVYLFMIRSYQSWICSNVFLSVFLFYLAWYTELSKFL